MWCHVTQRTPFEENWQSWQSCRFHTNLIELKCPRWHLTTQRFIYVHYYYLFLFTLSVSRVVTGYPFNDVFNQFLFPRLHKCIFNIISVAHEPLLLSWLQSITDMKSFS